MSGKVVPYEINVTIQFPKDEYSSKSIDKEMERKGFKLWYPTDSWVDEEKGLVFVKCGSFKDWKYSETELKNKQNG